MSASPEAASPRAFPFVDESDRDHRAVIYWSNGSRFVTIERFVGRDAMGGETWKRVDIEEDEGDGPDVWLRAVALAVFDGTRDLLGGTPTPPDTGEQGES